MKSLQKIEGILLEYSLSKEGEGVSEFPLLKNIRQRMAVGERLVFVLPAFPAKSPSQEKTICDLPDFGEVLALQNLQQLCDRITEVYPPGAELIICSDGRVFSDVVKVDDDVVDRYNDGIMSIIAEYNLHSLSVFTMDHLYPDLTPVKLRDLLLDIYAVTIEQTKNLVRTDAAYQSLFNGIHRFLCEDEMSMNANLSRSAAQKITKERTYELLRRSDAWSNLLNARFPHALRLSIHPHALCHQKFGIKLISSSNKWATPWHNVVVKIENRFELMHKREALNMNATLKMERDKYAYFEVTAV